MQESLYVNALKELVNTKDFYPYQSELLINPAESYWDKMPPDSIEGRKIVFHSNKNDDLLFQQNDNAIELLGLEPPKIDGDEMIVKINHLLCVRITTPIDEESWPKKLTEDDKNQMRNHIQRSENASEITSYSFAMNNKWTYVKFKFDCSERKFKPVSIDIKFYAYGSIHSATHKARYI